MRAFCRLAGVVVDVGAAADAADAADAAAASAIVVEQSVSIVAAVASARARAKRWRASSCAPPTVEDLIQRLRDDRESTMSARRRRRRRRCDFGDGRCDASQFAADEKCQEANKHFSLPPFAAISIFIRDDARRSNAVACRAI